MVWSDSHRKRIYNLWSQAFHRSSNPNEAENARSALARLQVELDISDVEAAFIAESEEKKLPDDSERLPDAFELLLHLFGESRIILNFAQEVIAALWILHTYVFNLYMHTPRLLLRSRKPGCGKTTLLSFTNLLVNAGFKSDNSSAASLYARLQAYPRSTLLLDEMENSTLWSRDPFLRALLDAGHRYDGCFSRQAKLGSKMDAVRFSVFAPLAYALVVSARNQKIRVPPQLLSRSLPIDMRFHSEGRDEILLTDPRVAEVRRCICEWVPMFQRPSTCEIPFVGRDRDNFQSLIEIGESLGYGATARAAALAIHRPIEDQITPLVFDICQVLEQQNEIKGIWTPELLEALHQLPNRPWDEYRGIDGGKRPHKLTRGELYDLLGDLDPPITSRTVQKVVGGERKSAKGFHRTQFEPYWHVLFGGTPAHVSKIIRLPRHKKQQVDDID
jgi:hypothetical protein